MKRLTAIIGILCICSCVFPRNEGKFSSMFFLTAELISTGPEFLTGNPAGTLKPGMHTNLFNTYISSYKAPGFFLGIEYTIDAFHKFDPTPAEKSIMDQYEIVVVIGEGDPEPLEEIRTSRSSFGISVGYQSLGKGKKVSFFSSIIPTYHKFDNGLKGPGYHKEDNGWGISAKIGIDIPFIEDIIGARISYTHGFLPAYQLPLLDGMRLVEGPGSFGALQLGFYFTTFDPEKRQLNK